MLLSASVGGTLQDWVGRNTMRPWRSPRLSTGTGAVHRQSAPAVPPLRVSATMGSEANRC